MIGELPNSSHPSQLHLGLMTPLISLQSPLPSCAGHCWEAQVQGGAGEDRTPATPGKDAASTLKGKYHRGSYMVLSPAAAASATTASHHSIIFIIAFFSWKHSSLHYRSLPPTLFQGSLMRVCLNLNSAYNPLAQREKSVLQ